MSKATSLMHTRASAWRRHAIVKSVVGGALLWMTALLAAQGQTWHAAFTAFAAGAFYSAAAITYAKARLWERVAAKKEEG